MVAVRAFHGRPSFTDQEASRGQARRLRVGGERLKTPALLAEIADVAGIEAARGVARARGGMETYFPTPQGVQGGSGVWLVEAVGKDAALKIAALFPMGCSVYIPLWGVALRRIEVLELSRAGRGANEIARLIGCSNRTVFRVRKSLKKEGLL